MARSPFATSFANAVRRHRRRVGLTQEALAEKAGLHPTYISMIENGHKVPTLDAAYRISTGLGVRLSKLIGEAEVRAISRRSG